MRMRAAPQKPQEKTQEIASGKSGIHTRLIRRAGASYVLALPKDLCLELGFTPATAFVTIRAVGPCIVIARATNVATPESRAAEADRALAALITAAAENGQRK